MRTCSARPEHSGEVDLRLRIAPREDAVEPPAEHFVESVADFKSAFAVFPELFNVALMGLVEQTDVAAAMRKIAEFTPQIVDAMQAMAVPDSLAEVLELWRARGLLAIDGGHLFQLGSWSSVLIGQHFEPGGVHPLTAAADPAVIAAEIRKIAAEVEAAAQALPPHDEFVANYCPADMAEAA